MDPTQCQLPGKGCFGQMAAQWVGGDMVPAGAPGCASQDHALQNTRSCYVTRAIDHIYEARTTGASYLMSSRDSQPNLSSLSLTTLRTYFAPLLVWLSVLSQPANQKVTGLIPGLGTCLGCRPGAQVGACERQLIDVSLKH